LVTAVRVLIVDCLGSGSVGRRLATVDVIGVGPRLIAGIIESLGINYDLITCDKVIKDPEVLRGYDVLMASGMSVDVPSMIKLVKLWGGRGLSIAGGPACVEYMTLLKYGYDLVVWGEAEGQLPKLIRLISSGDLSNDINAIPNIAYVKSGRVIKNPGPPFTQSDALWVFMPSVKVVRRYPGWWGARVYVEVVRGCSNFYRPTIKLPDGRSCTNCGLCRVGELSERIKCPAGIPPGCGYCSVPLLYGPARSRPLDHVIAEVRELVKLGVTRVVLSAPDFLDYGRDWLVSPKPLTDPRTPKPNLKAIEELLSKLHNIPEISLGEVYVMIENVKPNLVDEGVAKLLGKYLRGTNVSIGLETGDSRLHRALGRPSTVGEVVRAVKLLSSQGLKPYVYLIHGLPGEDEVTVANTIKVVKKLSKLGVDKITLYRFTPLRGTAFEGFPRPPAAVKSHNVRKLYELVRRLNRGAKESLLGKEVKSVVVGRRGPYLVTYPLPHGPVTYVRGPSNLIRTVVLVRCVKVLSDREVLGEVIKVLKLLRT